MEFTQEQLKAARMGEFQELAWHFRVELKPELSTLQCQVFFSDLIDFTESNKLGLGGEPSDFYLVSLLNRKAVTATEQKLLTDWLLARFEVSQMTIAETGLEGGLTDAWFIMMLVSAEGITTPSFHRFFS
ncbi:50S ribosome-binding protein YggL [Hymenobacter properus]|uniref:DUF469 family protein n=1 Tax=Hymenobacter properus TaxID=2791026 RepID=A0A931BHH9_9BACT|nr:50S ribosome-binding protein YggL [Hymenobacter properus]MBF9142463.1 DUF469 family protein [Hymenobacter properus]MBR7721270.1 DUF469 family protein [Microvirga sp. SRT04]